MTPLGGPDPPLFAAHCRALLEEGCHGIALLGTTGEINSFGLRQRMAPVDAVIEAGTKHVVLLPPLVELDPGARTGVRAEMERLGA